MRFGRGARTPSGRHRTPPGSPRGADLETDHEIEAYLQALSPTRDPESTDPGRRFGDAKVYQLRLPPDAETLIQRLAEQHGTSALSLIQGWVLQRLHHEWQGFDGQSRRFGEPAGPARHPGPPTAEYPGPPTG